MKAWTNTEGMDEHLKALIAGNADAIARTVVKSGRLRRHSEQSKRGGIVEQRQKTTDFGDRVAEEDGSSTDA